MSNVDNNNDILDSRDIISRIEELENDRDSWNDDADNDTTWEAEYPDDAQELTTLTDLAEECENYSEWVHGEVLVRYSYWEDYVQELLEDCGDIPRDVPHYLVIDWKQTADNISQDYAIIGYDGVDYYIRCC
jgi:hypothetical protein